MNFRFRRSIKIAPGIRINISKSGLSTSVGGRGLTWNSRGALTASIPGTGVSYRTNLSPENKANKAQAAKSLSETLPTLSPEENRKRQRAALLLILVTGAVLLFSVFPYLLVLLFLPPVLWLIAQELKYRKK
jgi:hypothetical protein